MKPWVLDLVPPLTKSLANFNKSLNKLGKKRVVVLSALLR
jgi:hypothetical protein